MSRVSFSGRLFCASRSFRAGKSTRSSGLILVEAGEHHRPRARCGIDMRLQALGADFLHHALHRRVDGCRWRYGPASGRAAEAVPRQPTACIMRSDR